TFIRCLYTPIRGSLDHFLSHTLTVAGCAWTGYPARPLARDGTNNAETLSIAAAVPACLRASCRDPSLVVGTSAHATRYLLRRSVKTAGGAGADTLSAAMSAIGSCGRR